MSDQVMRGLRFHLTTMMDSILRTALCEIMKAFENALHNHKMEVSQKGEEIAQLKIKLQTAEIKLKDLEFGRTSGAEIKPSGKKTEVSRLSSLPESGFGAPDDWCAPLGYETGTEQMKMCPTVKLRQFSIPLWQVPIKKEMLNCSINLQRSRSIRRSRRISAMNEQSKLAVINKKSRVRNDMKILLTELKHEDCDIKVGDLRRRYRREKTSKDGQKKDAPKQEKKQRTRAGNGPMSAELQNAKLSSNKKYSCRFCNKLFETRAGRNIHARFHRTCKGCKKVLSDVYTLHCHIQSCEKFKTRMAQEDKKPSTIFCDKINMTTPCNITVKEESVEVSVNRQTFTKKFTKSQRDLRNFIDTNGDPGWMRPLEYVEDN